MSQEKAKEFLDFLMKNPDLVDKMKGFTQEEFKEVVEELRNDGKIQENDEILTNFFI